MGNPKVKWTTEEEEALVRAIAKHGPGKWKLILQDPDFRSYLSNRTNVDLKDKYRNMNAIPGQGSNTRSRTPKPKLTQDVPATPAPVVNIQTPPKIPVAHGPVIIHAKEESVKDTPDAKNGSRYNNDTTVLIFEALSTAKEQNGMDIGSILSYIERRANFEMPQNFRKQLGARLRRLLNQGKLEKVENCYRVHNGSSVEINTSNQKDIKPCQPIIPAHLQILESLEEAAKTAAYKVAEAEEKTYFAALSVREAERLSKMQEESDTIFQLAQEIYARCHSNDSGVLLAA